MVIIGKNNAMIHDWDGLELATFVLSFFSVLFGIFQCCSGLLTGRIIVW